MNKGVKVTRPEDVVVGNMPKKRLKVLLRLGKYMYRFKWGYLAAIFISVMSNLLSLIGPKLSGEAIDAIGIHAGEADFTVVAQKCILMVIFLRRVKHTRVSLAGGYDKPFPRNRAQHERGHFRKAHADEG